MGKQSQVKISQMFAESSKKISIEEKAKEGIIGTAGFLAEHNLPMNLMEHFIDYLNAVGTDSDIVKQMKCKRTKMSRVLQKLTGLSQESWLLGLMRDNKFSIIIDESTDNSCTKHLCLVVRMCINFDIEDNFLALIPVVETTGAVLYEILINFLTENGVPYKSNFIGFASDGASNMVGVNNSVVSRLRENIPGIFIMICICHSFYLCESYACHKLPEEVEQFAREVYNYFSNSPKRVEEYKEFQEFANVSISKILHPSQTRWLSLECVVKRLLNQYEALRLYFVDQASLKISQANIILEKLNTPENKLYLSFLSHVLPIFNSLNKLMQSESPKIHVIYKEVARTVKTILDYYIKDEYLNANIENIDFKDPRLFLNLNDMYFSAHINSADLEKNRLDMVKLRCLDFYIESVEQILSRFPLKNSVFQKLEFLDPEVVKSRKIRSISNFSMLFQNLIPADMQVIDNEWLLLRNYEINFTWKGICDFWGKIAKIKCVENTESRFPNLSNFVFNLLTLPHSSANVERVFSQINLNKTKQRNRLKTPMIAAILHTKSLVGRENRICSNFPIGKDLLKKLNKQIYDSDESE
ncbi:uncharacterized protein LOC126750689 [Anthonomus grandis grandis]|uniref:uncharacterized protein LOC126750689 n=1 Tax=Anthonomus grandis grandis TaxID=2921223 RepID=UPI002165FAD8|nr:uncharacterized protein LOC126750689 [Anthonomus grandis grandis]